jgi:hypothetical protein
MHPLGANSNLVRLIQCPIPIEELRQLYEVEKLTDQAIVERIGSEASLKRVRSWRKRFGIETVSRSERNEVTPIEGPLRSLLVGSMLGDGRLNRLPNSTRFVENHSDAQREYIEWKAAQWGPWVKNGIKPVVWKKPEGDFKGWRFETVAHPTLNEWHSLFYDATGPKRLDRKVVDLVDAFALSLWFMDDGSVGWWPRITFGMEPESREVAFEILSKFSLKPRWEVHQGKTGDFLFDGEDQAHLFISLVKPHMPECMKHKLNFGFQGRHYEIRQTMPEARLREMALAGIPIRQIAREFGLAPTVVSRRLKMYSIQHPRRVGRPPE